MPPIPYVRRRSSDEERADAREKVTAAARAGETPSEHYKADDLAWAFRGHESELAELDAIAASAREARTQRARNREVAALATQIEAEWLETEKRERRERAFAEARERLGLPA